MIEKLDKGQMFDGWRIKNYESQMLDKINELIEVVNQLTKE